jgi:hypothetical protein
MALERRKATEGREFNLRSAEVKIRDSKMQGLASPFRDSSVPLSSLPGWSSFIPIFTLMIYLPFSFQKTAIHYSLFALIARIELFRHFVLIPSFLFVFADISASAFGVSICALFYRLSAYLREKDKRFVRSPSLRYS